ncbi:nitroreductase [Corynespora cassiicola Philippines]|uniref:Nitroreductase n=1 Tax=Corynespora cassiicola Philippines TaxID=1448308 RepID=A0A2T2NAL9_CORCC|nr:nitroreductase [Corynespora cassiicola Philippines]
MTTQNDTNPQPTSTSDPAPSNTPLSTLEALLQTRHSVRQFHPTRPVPRPALEKALSLAQLAPSNSNIQNWRLYLTTGSALSNLTAALTAASSHGAPNIPPVPQKYNHFRQALGAKIYGEAFQIARGDAEARLAKVRQNYRFFDAPVGGVVCMEDFLEHHDSLSVGLWLQSFMLALEAQGLGSCAMVSIAGYEGVVKEVLGLPEDMRVICGLAVGYEDEGHPVNRIRTERLHWSECCVLMGDE